MRKIALALTVVAFASFHQLQAQITDKLMPHLGFMWEFATASEAGGAQTEILQSFYNLNVGSYYILGQKNDIVSFGVQPNVEFGFNVTPTVSGNLRFNYNLQVPVYLMARIGAGATPYNQQLLGLALGIGGNLVNYSVFFASGNNLRTTYVAPGAVAEIHIQSRNSPMILRAHASPFQGPATFTNETPNGTVTQLSLQSGGYFGLGIVYRFGL